MWIFFVLAILLAFMFAVAGAVYWRYFTKYSIHETYFPLRMPFWGSIVAWVTMAAGLVTAAIETGMMRKPWRETWGWRIFLAGTGSWLGGWLGGVLSTYGLQVLTGWPVEAPPPPPDDKKKKG